MNQEEHSMIDEYLETLPLPQERKKLTAHLSFVTTDDESKALDKLAAELGIAKGPIVRAGVKTAIEHPAFMMCNLSNYISPEQMKDLADAFLEPEIGWPENLARDALLTESEEMLTSDQYDALMEVINDVLSPREREVIFYLYKEGLTLERTGKNYGVTMERIRQVRAKAFRKIHNRKNIIMMGYKDWVNRKAAEIARELYSAVQSNLTKEKMIEEEKVKDVYNPKIIELDLSVRSHNCLKRSGIERAYDLEGFGAAEFLNIRNLGKRSAREIATRVAERLDIDIYSLLTHDEAINDPNHMEREEFYNIIGMP